MISLMPGEAPDGTKCGNHIVNCGRGGIIDEVSAASALKSGKLTSLALDVFEKEPCGASPLMESANFQVLTARRANLVGYSGLLGREHRSHPFVLQPPPPSHKMTLPRIETFARPVFQKHIR